MFIKDQTLNLIIDKPSKSWNKWKLRDQVFSKSVEENAI